MPVTFADPPLAANDSGGMATLRSQLDGLTRKLTKDYWVWSGENFPGDGTIRFPLDASRTITYQLATGVGAVEAGLIRYALDAWTDVTGITFREAAANPQITFRNDGQDAWSQFTLYVGNSTQTADVNIGQAWINRYGTTLNSYTMQSYVHEIGHALGLGHPGNYNLTATVPGPYLDRHDMTIMSYFPPGDADDQVFDYVVTPMIGDVAAIQWLYGSDISTRSGNTVYGIGANFTGYLRTLLDQVTGNAPRNTALWTEGQTVAFTLHDTGGANTINFSSDTQDQVVNLCADQHSDVYGTTRAMFLTGATMIHSYIAGSGNDSITGNRLANRIEGGVGNDTLNGFGGDDSLIGGAGTDTAVFQSDQNLRIDLNATGIQMIGPARCLIAGFENLTTGTGHDSLTGTGGANNLDAGAGNDTLLGHLGNDTLDGGLGDDLIDGGGGVDTIVFSLPSPTRIDVEVDLRQAAAQATGMGNDRLLSIENITTGRGDDTLSGNDGANRLDSGIGTDRLFGYGGNDTLLGGDQNDELTGGLGDDLLDGGAGIDMALFVGADAIRVDLTITTAQRTGLGLDRLIGIENIASGSGDDILRGSDEGNRLYAMAGNDLIYGMDGRDWLFGGDGGDRLSGGRGADFIHGGGPAGMGMASGMASAGGDLWIWA